MKHKTLKQKKIFLNGEADNWFIRNKKSIKKNNILKNKMVTNVIKQLIDKQNLPKNNFLEVGCANGEFLLNLKKKIKSCKVFGLDPSQKGIKELKQKKVDCHVGTADNIPFKKNTFDIIFFNFCLYLCDQSDYKKIYQSADKVLKKDGFIIIYDFFSKKMKKIPYKHDKRLFSIKRDFRKIFNKDKKYECIYHKIFNYSKFNKVTSFDKNDLLSISVMKNKNFEKFLII